MDHNEQFKMGITLGVRLKFMDYITHWVKIYGTFMSFSFQININAETMFNHLSLSRQNTMPSHVKTWAFTKPSCASGQIYERKDIITSLVK